eukprot:scaffold221017_cov35-Attheya_sp.AAC.1
MFAVIQGGGDDDDDESPHASSRDACACIPLSINDNDSCDIPVSIPVTNWSNLTTLKQPRQLQSHYFAYYRRWLYQ